MKKGKVVLVGTGFVGMSMAYSMLNRGGINELVLIDIDKDKTIGEEMDLSHGLPFAPQKMVIKAGDYDECKEDRKSTRLNSSHSSQSRMPSSA